MIAVIDVTSFVRSAQSAPHISTDGPDSNSHPWISKSVGGTGGYGYLAASTPLSTTPYRALCFLRGAGKEVHLPSTFEPQDCKPHLHGMMECDWLVWALSTLSVSASYLSIVLALLLCHLPPSARFLKFEGVAYPVLAIRRCTVDVGLHLDGSMGEGRADSGSFLGNVRHWAYPRDPYPGDRQPAYRYGRAPSQT